jgi:hypothetical protein
MQPFYSVKYLIVRMTQIRFIVTVISLTIFSVFSKAQCPETNPICNATNNWVVGDNLGIKWVGSDSLEFILSR